MSDNSNDSRPSVYESIAQRVYQRGWCVWPGFVPPAQVWHLATELYALREVGGLRKAGIGHGPSFQVRPEVRGDFVRWLETGRNTSAQEAYLARLEQLRLALNQKLFLGLYQFEGHLALYPPGSFYARHLDQFAEVRYRQVTCVLYLNPDWQDSDGGQLRLYLPHEGGERAHDVTPQAGTLACFLSAEFEHEVLPTARERASITGWFRRRQ